MKLGIWPFGNKSNENNVTEYVTINNVPLEQVSCNILKEEIVRRKKENYDRKVREANAKADKVDKLIDELCNEMAIDIETKSKSTYQEVLAKRLTHSLIPFINDYCYRTRYGHQDLDIDSNIYDSINYAIYETDIDVMYISRILKHIKVEYRKILLKNIKEEC